MFLRWGIQFMEKGVKKLSFKNSGVSCIVHIHGFEELAWTRFQRTSFAQKDSFIASSRKEPQAHP